MWSLQGTAVMSDGNGLRRVWHRWSCIKEPEFYPEGNRNPLDLRILNKGKKWYCRKSKSDRHIEVSSRSLDWSQLDNINPTRAGIFIHLVHCLIRNTYHMSGMFIEWMKENQQKELQYPKREKNWVKATGDRYRSMTKAAKQQLLCVCVCVCV